MVYQELIVVDQYKLSYCNHKWMDYYGKYAPTSLLLTNNVGIVMLLLC